MEEKENKELTKELMGSYPEGIEAIIKEMLDFVPEEKKDAWFLSFYKTILKR